MNVSPGEYLTNLRFNEGCRLLKKSPFPVFTVAEIVGMTPNAFSKLFRARTGVSPGTYRKEK